MLPDNCWGQQQQRQEVRAKFHTLHTRTHAHTLVGHNNCGQFKTNLKFNEFIKKSLALAALSKHNLPTNTTGAGREGHGRESVAFTFLLQWRAKSHNQSITFAAFSRTWRPRLWGWAATAEAAEAAGEWSRERSSVSRDHKRFFMCPIIEVKSMALPPLHTINTKVVSYHDHDNDDVKWKLRCETKRDWETPSRGSQATAGHLLRFDLS